MRGRQSGNANVCILVDSGGHYSTVVVAHCEVVIPFLVARQTSRYRRVKRSRKGASRRAIPVRCDSPGSTMPLGTVALAISPRCHSFLARHCSSQCRTYAYHAKRLSETKTTLWSQP